LNLAKIDADVDNALGASYHDKEGGFNTTAVRWWVRFNLALGDDPFAVAGPDAPDVDKLRDERRLMRFEAWLVMEKKPTVTVDTAEGYGSTVQGFLARYTGTKLGAGRDLHRLRNMRRGLHRLNGGKPQRKLRKALTPQRLGAAMDKRLLRSNPAHANVRAALTTMVQGLLRGGEAGISDKAVRSWAPKTHITRADVYFTHEAMHLTIAPLKNEHYLGAKACPVVIGRQTRAGAYIDAPSEVLNMYVVDSVLPGEWGLVPMFRDPSTGKPLKVSELNDWVQLLMNSIGEDGKEYGSHSCRIGGATAMFAAGATPLDIRTMGRWDSEVYRIYIRADAGRAAHCSRAIGRKEVSPLQDAFEEIDYY